MQRAASAIRFLRSALLAGAAALAVSACATSPTTTASIRAPDFSGLPASDAQARLTQLAEQYRARPNDKVVIVYYAAALRANGQADQAVAVLEAGLLNHPKDIDIRVAFAKALVASGRFEQALNVVEGAINPAQPDWNALSVKGAILDQVGRNAEARVLYQQALTIAPQEASLYANLGLSYAMTNELEAAEANLRRAISLPGATSQIRQNLALVVGLQGRFDESRALYAAELPAEQVEDNMAYIKALLTQQNRWDLIRQG